MILTTYTDPGRFLERVQPFLESKEAVNNLVLGNSIGLRDNARRIEQPPYLAAVEDASGDLVLVALHAPPRHLMLSGDNYVPQAAIHLLVQNLRDSGARFSGVNAENGLALQFAESWSRASGQAYTTRWRERLYTVQKVVPPLNPPPGFFRLAAKHETALLAAWNDAFTRESLHEEPPPDTLLRMERAIQAGSLFVWEDGRPVSVAVRNRVTPHGACIGGVYTPPELRGQGYASACVAALSQHLLDSGKQFCALFTDLDFPTSNAIYQKIGYTPVCDFMLYIFE